MNNSSNGNNGHSAVGFISPLLSAIFWAVVLGVGVLFTLVYVVLYFIGSRTIADVTSACYLSTTVSFLALIFEKVLHAEGIILFNKGKFFEPSGKWYFTICKLLVLVSYSIILYTLVISDCKNNNSCLLICSWIVYGVALLPSAYSLIRNKSSENEVE